MKHLLIAAASLSLLTPAASALAQGTAERPEGGMVEVDDESRTVDPYGRTVDEIEDMDLYTEDGEEVGEIEEVLMDGEGRIVALSAEVGGFLGVGEKDVVLQFDQVQFQNDRFIVSMTKEQLEMLPDWDE